MNLQDLIHKKTWKEIQGYLAMSNPPGIILSGVPGLGTVSYTHLDVYKRQGLYYNPNLDSSDMCYITEGEKKAILTNDYLRYPVISLPGTGTYNKLYDLYDGINAINFLKSIGCDTTVVAYDADKIYNQQVLRYEQKLVQLLQGEGSVSYTHLDVYKRQ